MAKKPGKGIIQGASQAGKAKSENWNRTGRLSISNDEIK
jgi:hypothetical protein